MQIAFQILFRQRRTSRSSHDGVKGFTAIGAGSVARIAPTSTE